MTMAGEKPKISFGFKKVEAPSKPHPIAKPAGLSLGDDDGDDDDLEGKASKAASSSRWPPPPPASVANAPASRATKQRQQQALEVDEAVFDYDGVYDRMKSAEREKTKQRQEDNKKRDPKYMDAFLKSTEDRKRYLARAEAKKIQRERDQEGDEFAGTEAFVTEAYKEQLEDIRAQEEKEAKEEAQRRNKSKGVASFYRDMLASNDQAHEAAVAATLSAGKKDASIRAEAEDTKKDSEKERIKEAVERGSQVRLNDDNEVVDERSLLSAGLNVLGKKKKAGQGEDGREHREQYTKGKPLVGAGSQRDGAREAREAREAQRARQSRLIEEQMLEMEEKRRQEAEREQEEAKKRAVGEKRNDAASVASARERALARKRQRMG